MLIKSIKINNFRCFNKTEAKDFSNINLLGGKNNAGKTALLEALLLALDIDPRSIEFLLKFRNIDEAFVKNMPQKAFDNLFYDIQKKIEITAAYEDGYMHEMGYQELTAVLSVEIFNNYSAILKIQTVLDNEVAEPIDESWLVARNSGLVRKNKKNSQKSPVAYFMPTGFVMTSEQLGQQFDKLKYQGHSETLLEAFQIIDATIDKVDSFNIGKPAIYLRRKGGNFMHLSLFGDAMTKIAIYILGIIGNQNSVILIDEIENGIHHTNQKHLWKMLFDLSQRFGVQIFATTHSAEMIEAFKNTVKENEFESQARYFEMARHSVSNEIIVQKIPMNALEQKLITKKPMRGE